MTKSYTVKQKFVFLAKYDDKIINIPYRNVYQRTWKLVDCKIYNSSTRGKSIQNQSTTPFGRCGLTLDWFTTSEIVIDFAIHQLSGPLISTVIDSCSKTRLGSKSLPKRNHRDLISWIIDLSEPTNCEGERTLATSGTAEWTAAAAAAAAAAEAEYNCFSSCKEKSWPPPPPPALVAAEAAKENHRWVKEHVPEEVKLQKYNI